MKDKRINNQEEPAGQQVGGSAGPETNWEGKAKEYEAGWQRAVADLDNYRKDAERRNVEMVEFLRAGSVVKFLSIYDDLGRAVEFVTDEKAKQGLLDVQKKFKDLLRADGLEEIDQKAGEEYDPNLAEAVSYEENEVGEGKVIETVEVGLKINGRVIKPAKVRVGK
jgi:molecular chaperone GrpE